MKVYLFIETGEIRNPLRDEWCLDIHGQPSQGRFIAVAGHIVTRHEIEIPDNAQAVSVVPPKPKKTVRKWQYVAINQDSRGRKRAEISGWLTAKEAVDRGLPEVRKVYETMVEVEE